MTDRERKIGKFLSDCWIEYLTGVLRNFGPGERFAQLAEKNVPGTDTAAALQGGVPAGDVLDEEDWHILEVTPFTTLETWCFQYRLAHFLEEVRADRTALALYRQTPAAVLSAYGLSPDQLPLENPVTAKINASIAALNESLGTGGDAGEGE